jgi:hypothetical protein
LEEKCFFCENVATKQIGNEFICESCISDVYSLLNRNIQIDIKNGIDHNEQIIHILRKIGEEISGLKRDIRELKRNKR